MESASVVAPDGEPLAELSPPPAVAAPLPEIAEVAIVEDLQQAGPAAAAAPVAGLGGFAPPTMATRAEVLYGQIADESTGAADYMVAPTLAETSTAGGVASVVFVDDPVEEGAGGNERSSALRRLIGSLRRKDH